MTATPAISQQKLMGPQDVERGHQALAQIRDGLSRAILGQPELVDLTVVALAARGHLLLEGLPGLGKTELVKTLSRILGLSFKRVQFTPDLLPSDITGGLVLQENNGQRNFVFQRGPLFANLVLADEINRASPKTQSALLEAMQEKQVTVIGETHRLPEPFFVLATQNPIELEGTYPLPEAQLDRFLFKVEIPSVGEDVLGQIIKERRRGQAPELGVILSLDRLQELFGLVDQVFLPEAVARYIARLVAGTHPQNLRCPDAVKKWVKFGASPRAAIALAESSRACALLAKRPNVDFADVEKVAVAVLGHRLVLDPMARLEGMSSAAVVKTLLQSINPLERELPQELK